MLNTEKQLKLNNRIAIKERKAFDACLDDKPNKWRAWKHLIDQNNKIMELTNILGVDYTFDRVNRFHIFKDWVIPSYLNNEDIALKWIAHDVLRHVNGCQVILCEGWESKSKKTQIKNINKLVIALDKIIKVV